MFGFAFSGDEFYNEDGTPMKNSYIHCARTLAKNKNTGTYKPVYQTLTEDFIARELLVRSKKRGDVKNFVDQTNREWDSKNKQSRYEGSVNLLLKPEESIEMVDDGASVKVMIHFDSGDNYIEVEVESD